MPLFREHRGQLIDSLKTTVIVNNMNELYAHLTKIFDLKYMRIVIEPYPAEGENFDKRIGWYTQIIILEEDGVLGFLSEPLRG